MLLKAFLPVSHTGRSLDPGLVGRSIFLHGSLPSRSAPWPSSLWHYERGQTPSPKAHKDTAWIGSQHRHNTYFHEEIQLVLQSVEFHFQCNAFM